MSEPGVSGGCVADPVARAKGGPKRLDTFTVPRRVQPAGRINQLKILTQGRFGVNRYRAVVITQHVNETRGLRAIWDQVNQ
jgi:hypothetical protein